MNPLDNFICVLLVLKVYTLIILMDLILVQTDKLSFFQRGFSGWKDLPKGAPQAAP